jgi:polar amino acid transport system substrate-binding protein
MSETGESDGYFPEYYDNEIMNHAVFSQPFATSPVGFIKLKSKLIDLSKKNNIYNYKIGVVKGYVNENKFDADQHIYKEESLSDIINLRKLLAGRLDMIVIDKHVSSYILKKEFPDRIQDVEFLNPPLIDHQLYVCFSVRNKSHKKILKAFNSGLEILKKSGEYDKIIAKYQEEYK